MNLFMFEDWEYPGLFWEPGKQDQYKSGVLSYKVEQGLSLRLMDTQNLPLAPDVTKVNFSTNYSSPESGCLQGYLFRPTGSGWLVTLLDFLFTHYGFTDISREFKSRSNFPDVAFRHLMYSPQYALIGAHFYKAENLNVQMLAAKFPFLHHWMKHADYQTEVNEETSELMIKYSLSGKLEYRLGQATLSLESSWSIHKSGKYWGVLSDDPPLNFNPSTLVRLRSEQPQSLKWYQTQFGLLRDFFSLCLQHPLYFKALAGSKVGKSPNPPFISLVMNQPNQPSRHMFYRPLLDFDDVKPHLEKMLNTFCEGAEQYKDIYGILLTEPHQNQTNSIELFLKRCQALELYHAQRFQGQEWLVPELQYRDKIEKPIEALLQSQGEAHLSPEQLIKLQTHIQQALQAGNSRDFQDQLHDLLALGKIKTQLKMKRPFLEKIARTRDYHSQIAQPGKILTGHELVAASSDLKKLIYLLLYQDWGLPLDHIGALKEAIK